MPNYQNGKIYKIVSDETEKIYIGSTAKTKLSERMCDHRQAFRLWTKGRPKYTSSFEILQYKDSRIVLVENWPCNNKDELRQREEYHRKLNKDQCCNIVAAYQSKEELLQYKKNWTLQNIDKIRLQKKVYNEKNKDKIAKRQKIYAQVNKQTLTENRKKYKEKNKERLKNYGKEYREKNKDLIKQKKSIKLKCNVCYNFTTSSHFGRHKKSKIHKKAVMKDIHQMKETAIEHIAQREQRKHEFEYLVGEFDKN